jgi:GNAT superfamily N-acetyltransferase
VAGRKRSSSAGLAIAEETRIAATARAVLKGLVAYNTEKAGKTKWKRFAISVRDKDGAIKGGLVGYTMWNWCFVELLWIDEALRGTGIGTDLIARAEAIAVKRGAQHIYLDTFSFQGDGFYQRLGYEVYGELDDFPPGHRRIWLKKDLA